MERQQLIKKALRLEWFTFGWMVIEAAVAIGAGIAAHSLLLVAFGIDSIIELASAVVLLWRMYAELVQGREFSETIERRASRISGLLLFALAGYVFVAAMWKLAGHNMASEFSVVGFIVTVVAIPAMYLLAKAKFKLADALGSHSLRADATESLACGYLSSVVLFGLIVQRVTGLWWIDPAASLVIVYFLIKEGRMSFMCEDHEEK